MLHLSIATLSDRVAHCLFSRDPYRHVQVAIRVTNDGDVTLDGVSFELLIPENGIFNLNGDAWNPLYKESVEGTTYDVWQTLGGGGYAYGSRSDGYFTVGQKYAAVPGGVTISPKGSWAQKLAVNLKPYDSSIDLLWRLFQKGDPIGDYGTASVALQAYTQRF